MILTIFEFEMSKIIDKFLLTGNKSMPELHLNSQDLFTVFVDHLLNILEEFKNHILIVNI